MEIFTISCDFHMLSHGNIHSLSHSNADNPLVIKNFSIPDASDDLITMQDQKLQLSFTTEKNRLTDNIISQPCVLVLKGPRGFRAYAELENESILAQEKITGIVIFENDQEEQCAMAHVYVEVKDLGPNFNNPERSFAFRRRSPQMPRLDEEVAYKVVEELEDWKAKQKENFMSELKRREINHLAHLSNEWQRRRAEQEAKLANRLEHCELLTKSLEEAYAAVREQADYDETREKQWIKAKEDVERKCDAKVRELRERIRELEQEAAHKSKRDELNRMEIELKLKFTTEENTKLRARVRELELLVHNSLPKEQVAGLYIELVSLSWSMINENVFF